MAEIKIYRSQTPGRALPQGGPLNLQAPDQGIVGRAVAQLGEVVGVIGEKRAELAASSRAATAHSSYQNEMLKVERTARRMKPEDAEAYYLQHSKNEYDKASNSLSSSYSKTLFAVPAGKSAYRSRANFYKEHDARLVSASIAGSNNEAEISSTLAANLFAELPERYDAIEDMFGQITKQVEGGWITAQVGRARREELALGTLKRIMMQKMQATNSPMDVVDDLADSNDPVVRRLINEDITGDELDKFVREQRATADKMETKRRQQATAADKVEKAADDADVRFVMNASLGDATTPSNVLEAVELHKDLIARNVYTYNERLNAEKTLALMGVPEYMDDGAGLSPASWRKASDGDVYEATVSLTRAESEGVLTAQMILGFAQKGMLTRAGFERWNTAVAGGSGAALTSNIQLFASKFKYERYQNSDRWDKETTQSAYQNASTLLREWHRGNPIATRVDIDKKADEIIGIQYEKFREELAERFSSEMFSAPWMRVLATVDDPSAAGMLKTARKFYAKALSSTPPKTNDMATAKDVIDSLIMYQEFKVIQ